VFYLLQYLRPIFIEIARNKQTTGLGHVTVADMKRLQVVEPLDFIGAGFEVMVGPIFDYYYVNLLESRKLAAIRDTLLPKLISGDLRVSQAPSMVEEAV
jgi:type I restriction enzyme S subunit